MEWAKVEGSSQIAEMGYDAEQKVLGVRFQPTRRQAELGQPGSEYHYANVDVALATGLALAESKGKYFGENIKPFPVQYPFTKITPQPLPGIKGAVAGFMKDHGVSTVKAGRTVITQEPDWNRKCEVCGASPVVPITGMCGPCTFGDASTVGGNW